MPTFAQLRERFPNASLGFLAANASDGLPPELCPRKPEVVPVQVKGATPAKTQRKPRVSRAPRTRNAGTWTEAQFWQAIRSCLRRMSRFWKPARAALHAARFPCKGPKGQRWAYLCHDCKKPFPRKQVQIDHVVPCGALTDFEHMGEFLRRLTPEDPAAYAVRCLSCHQQKTNSEREKIVPRGEPVPVEPCKLALVDVNVAQANGIATPATPSICGRGARRTR